MYMLFAVHFLARSLVIEFLFVAFCTRNTFGVQLFAAVRTSRCMCEDFRNGKCIDEIVVNYHKHSEG